MNSPPSDDRNDRHYTDRDDGQWPGELSNALIDDLDANPGIFELKGQALCKHCPGLQWPRTSSTNTCRQRRSEQTGMAPAYFTLTIMEIRIWLNRC